MYRTLLATCGSEDFRGLYSIKLRIFGFHFRGATRCKQRAVHCLSMKIYLSSYVLLSNHSYGPNHKSQQQKTPSIPQKFKNKPP